MSKILVVDDEKDVVTLIKFLLQKDGHEVIEASNGEEALQIISQTVPDLIILDVMMPIMDGYTFNTKLQENFSLRTIPVIILTARGQMKDLFQVAPNVSAYIEKPFDPKHLRDLIQKTLLSSKVKGD
ncbi:MAG: response regulator [Elusimicrobia bacterium]|nr:response regulator [Elusimicrobiota bacterium]